jgi:hypothetical protein
LAVFFRDNLSIEKVVDFKNPIEGFTHMKGGLHPAFSWDY